MSAADFMRHHLGGPVQVVERCPVTGRIYERGSGALSHAEQTAMFLREAQLAADMPRDGDYCPQTGRPYQVGSGARTRTEQSAAFLAELSPEQLAHRRASFEAFKALEIQGRA